MQLKMDVASFAYLKWQVNFYAPLLLSGIENYKIRGNESYNNMAMHFETGFYVSSLMSFYIKLGHTQKSIRMTKQPNAYNEFVKTEETNFIFGIEYSFSKPLVLSLIE
jgi:hypothetical protein